MQTKAELEAEIIRLRERVAELEGAVAAYQYALAHKEPVMPMTYPATDHWNWWQFPKIVTTPNSATYDFNTE